ncbi:hypothetical protein LINGRAHAP2_LOCUS4586 [Linum grandiflorum]
MSTKVYGLPKYLALKSKSNGNYLKIIGGEGSPHERGLLQFSEDTVMSPFAKFEREEFDPRETREEIVHMRCCYNNKYWVVKGPDNKVFGGADVPEGDRSKPTCTLFKPEFLDGDDQHKTVRLLHVQLNRYVCPSIQDADVLIAASGNKQDDMSDVYDVVDLTELVELPKRVILKGDNEKYLKPQRGWIYPTRLVPPSHPKNDLVEYLKFSGDDRWDRAAVHQVIPNPDGTIRFKSEDTGKYWGAWAPNSRERTWIRCDQEYYNSNNQVFSIVKVRDTVIALKNNGNGQYCKRLEADWKYDYLAPATDSITDGCVELIVEEPVVLRTIEDLVYYNEELRVHGQSEEKHPTPLRSHVNRHQTPEHQVYRKKVKTRTTSTWTRTDTWTKTSKLNFEFKVEKIPFGAHYEAVKEENRVVTWGEVKDFESEIELEIPFTVLPMKKATVYMKTRTEIRDLPFSYTQLDKQRDGKVENTRKFDGMYISTITIPETEVIYEDLTR